MKRFLSILLSVTLLMCSLAIPTALGEELPYYEMQVFSQNANFAGLQSGWFGKLINPDLDMQMKTNQIGDAVKHYSWKMAYAESDEQFDSLYNEMMEKVRGFGYEEAMEFYRLRTEQLYETRDRLVGGTN